MDYMASGCVSDTSEQSSEEISLCSMCVSGSPVAPRLHSGLSLTLSFTLFTDSVLFSCATGNFYFYPALSAHFFSFFAEFLDLVSAPELKSASI